MEEINKKQIAALEYITAAMKLLDGVALADLQQALEIYAQFNRAQKTHFSAKGSGHIADLFAAIDGYDDSLIYLYDAETGAFVDAETETGFLEGNWRIWMCSVADKHQRVLMALDGWGQMRGTSTDEEIREAHYESSAFSWTVRARITQDSDGAVLEKDVWLPDYPEELLLDRLTSLMDTTWSGKLPITVEMLDKKYNGKEQREDDAHL